MACDRTVAEAIATAVWAGSIRHSAALARAVQSSVPIHSQLGPFNNVMADNNVTADCRNAQGLDEA